MMRRTVLRYQVIGGVASRGEKLHFDPFQNHVEVARNSALGTSQSGARDNSVATNDLRRWMEVKHAAAILQIPPEKLYGIRPDEIRAQWEIVMQSQRLNSSALNEVYVAAETLIEYSLSDYHDAKTKEFYRKELNKQRLKLKDEIQKISDDVWTKVIYLTAVTIVLCGIVLAAGGLVVMYYTPSHKYVVMSRVGSTLFELMNIKPNTARDPVPPPPAAEIPGARTDIADPVYKEILEEAGRDLQRERNYISSILRQGAKL